jgi:hypothetical protein
MWLIVRDEDHTVVGTNYADDAPIAPAGHTVKPWFGQEPGEGDPDPTLNNLGWEEQQQTRVDFDALAGKAANEIAWLEATIPGIGQMTAAQVRDVVARLARENLEMIRAWRYVLRRL